LTREFAQVGSRQGFRPGLEAHPAAVQLDHGQAGTIDGHAVAEFQTLDQGGGGDGQSAAGACWGDSLDLAQGFHQSREHGLKSAPRQGAMIVALYPGPSNAASNLPLPCRGCRTNLQWRRQVDKIITLEQGRQGT
jgi:hypothetical protein